MKYTIRTIFLTALVSCTATLVLLRWNILPLRQAALPDPPESLAAPPPKQPVLSPEEERNIQVYGKVSPGVVNITSTVVEFDFFFAPVQTEGSTGSGAVLDLDGNIVTNYHVVANAQELQVSLPDQSQYPAKLIGVDPQNDLAVVRITEVPKDRLHPIPLGESQDLKVGQRVLAIGNPFRLQNTLTTGIISAVDRTIKTETGDLVNNIIQTDAAINPGNSGGPLLNTVGELIGINTSIFTTSGGNIGIGFAVPVNTVRRVVKDLLEHGRVLRPWPGLAGYSITGDLARALDLPVRRGILVARVYQGGSADAGGIRGATQIARVYNERILIGGDIITEVDGQPVKSTEDLRLALEERRPGDTALFTIYRGSTRLQRRIPLVEHPRQRGFRF